MPTVDGSRVPLLPAGREITTRALWALRVVFGGVALYTLVLLAVATTGGAWDNAVTLTARLLGVLLVYRVSLRLLSSETTDRSPER